MKKIWRQIWGIQQIINRELLLDADVVRFSSLVTLQVNRALMLQQVCTTCISAISANLNSIDFPIVFLDEASMATEPLTLLPLMKGVSHFFFVPIPMQALSN